LVMLQKFFRNENISKRVKLRLKNTIIHKTLTYASEILIQREIERKSTFFKGKCIEEF
jgi:hypothetical protein